MNDKHIKDLIVQDHTFSIWFIAEDNYYEVYDQAGNCLNEGELLLKLPTKNTIQTLINE